MVPPLNWRRGLIRAWVVGSLSWICWALVERWSFHQKYAVEGNAYAEIGRELGDWYFLIYLFAYPALAMLIGWSIISIGKWIARGLGPTTIVIIGSALLASPALAESDTFPDIFFVPCGVQMSEETLHEMSDEDLDALINRVETNTLKSPQCPSTRGKLVFAGMALAECAVGVKNVGVHIAAWLKQAREDFGVLPYSQGRCIKMGVVPIELIKGGTSH